MFSRKLFYIASPFVVLGIIVLILLGMIHSVGSEKTLILGGNLVIEKGMTAHGLHEKLELDSPIWLYKIWLKKEYPQFSLSAGSYPVRPGASVDELFGHVLLYQPQAQDIQVTILPGWHIGEVERQLKSSMGATTESMDLVRMDSALVQDLRSQYPFLGYSDSLEGFLYPDTYRFYPDASLRDIVEVMLARFDEEIYTKYHAGADTLDFYDTLKLASIVEEEEKVTTNKPMVAGILKKRLDEGWHMGADVTVCYQDLVLGEDCQRYVNSYYGLSEGQKAAQQNIYDTRRNLGLPPTPVASVSANTFASVIDYETSPYYYYLHDGDGIIRYGRDAAEHAANKEQYLY